MLKNKLYPFVEKYINEYLYGFTKEQLQVGLTNGTIALENLNIRPDKVNEKLNDKNLPIWLKAGLISKISISCSLMNFIGEKPLDVVVSGVDVIVTPSYKWIIKNIHTFVEENVSHIRDPYDPNENNSFDIFTKKVNIFDNSIFKQTTLLEIFKDGSKISQMINKVFKMCFKFYYMKNYMVNATVKNIHIRFEDDQLINYVNNIALGCKINSIEVNLSAEGIMKRNSFKLDKLDVYWESKPKILISSELLHNSFDKDNALDEKYYAMLRQLNFGKFSYVGDTKFLIENFNCMGNFGTQSLNSSNSLDLFGKRENNFQFYVQFASSEVNINIFPDLIAIVSNFRKFIREFSVIEQVQDFKPMKKPYNAKNPLVSEIINNDEKNEVFAYKKKLVVRDWLFYFFWCRKCNSSIYGRGINPLRLEFIRFFNLCFTNWENEEHLNDSIDMKKDKDKDKKDHTSILTDKSNAMAVPTEENPNPDNVNLSFSGEFLVKGMNIHLHSGATSSSTKSYVTVTLSGVEIKPNLSKDQCSINVSMKSLGLGPNELFKGERQHINSNVNQNETFRTNTVSMNSNNNHFSAPMTKTQQNPIVIRHRSKIDNEENSTDRLIKNNPILAQRMKILNETLYPTSDSKHTIQSNANDPIKSKNGNQIPSQAMVKVNDQAEIKRKKSITSSFINDLITKDESQQQRENEKLTKAMTLSRQIEEHNLRMKKKQLVPQPKPNQNQNQTQNQSVASAIVPLSLFEIYSYPNTSSINLQFSKSNNSSNGDLARIKLGFIRVNLFEEYVSTCLSIISEYQSLLVKPTKAPKGKMVQSIIEQKQLLIMKKYIYTFLSNSKEAKTPQIAQYMLYLKKEIDASNKMLLNNDNLSKGNFEINYIFSLFSRGIEIDFDYESFECAYYKKEGSINAVLGKALIPRIDLRLLLDLSRIYLKFYDFEFEIKDLGNTKILMTTLIGILSDKLKKINIFIEPCLKELKFELEKHNDNTETLIPSIEDRFPKNTVNLISDLKIKGSTKQMPSSCSNNGDLINNNNTSSGVNKNMNEIAALFQGNHNKNNQIKIKNEGDVSFDEGSEGNE